MEWSTMALLPEVRFEIAASPIHCPSIGAEGFLCAGVPLLKKLRAATRDENPRAQNHLGHGVVDAGRPQELPKTVGQTLQHQPVGLQPFVLTPMWEEP